MNSLAMLFWLIIMIPTSSFAQEEEKNSELALFLHLSKWQFALAPGVEFAESETNAVIRAGVEYQIELGEKYSLAPTLNLDSERRGDLSIIYGLSAGIKL